MERYGFIHGMLDTKVLILYVVSRLQEPVNRQNLYSLCFQDDGLDYFEFCQALPEMEETGHLHCPEPDVYEITELGFETDKIMSCTLAYPVAQRAAEAVEKFNRNVRRSAMIGAEAVEQSDGNAAVRMSIRDENGKLMELELYAPSLREGRKLERIFKEHAEQIYKAVMNEFMKYAPKDNF